MAQASIAAADSAALRVNVGHGDEDKAPAEDDASCPKLNFDSGNEVNVMQGQCPACYNMCETRMLMTSIPLFREIIVASLNCEHCGHQNTSVDFAGAYQEQGSVITLRVDCPEDLQRQVVKSDSCNLRIPEMEFEIQPNAEHKAGVFTTLQGVLAQAIEGIEWMVWNWRQQIPQQPENTDTIMGLLADLTPKKDQLEVLMQGEAPFTFIMDDPAGNSFISSLTHTDLSKDPKLTVQKYTRTAEQNSALGFTLGDEGVVSEQNPEGIISSQKPLGNATVPTGAASKPKITYDDSAWLKFEANEELDEAVMQFQSYCEACGAENVCNMYQFKVPHFREVILMAATCENCGNKSREIKPGGAVPELGRRCTLNFKAASVAGENVDLRRGVIKSDTASVMIPEIELEMEPGTLGGMFTTVEGLLMKIREHLRESNPFGDEGDGRNTLGEGASVQAKFKEFLDKIEQLETGLHGFTLIMQDSMAGSFIENPLAPEEDPQLKVEDYERSHEENEDLGLNQMKTENYEEDHKREQELLKAQRAAAAEEMEEESFECPYCGKFCGDEAGLAHHMRFCPACPTDTNEEDEDEDKPMIDEC